jgi:hypothetical protein
MEIGKFRWRLLFSCGEFNMKNIRPQTKLEKLLGAILVSGIALLGGIALFGVAGKAAAHSISIAYENAGARVAVTIGSRELQHRARHRELNAA